jgi:phage tail sheath protein FI
MGATDRGPAVPTLVTSWSQYTSLYGSWGTRNTVTTAAYLFFANGGKQCYIQRVTAGSPVAATRTFKDTNTPTATDTLTITAKNVGSWGNSIKIETTAGSVTGTFTLVVYYGGVQVERFRDLTMLTSSAYYAVSIINATSKYVVATDASPSDSHTASDNPAAVSAIELASGADGTAPTSANVVAAASAFDTVTTALLLNAPAVVAATDVNALITYAEGRGDVFVVVDALNDTVSAQLTRASAYTSSSYAAVYYPNLNIPDPATTSTTGAVVVAPCGAAVIGRYVSTDASRGVFKSPAGLEARISGAVSVAKLTNAELDSLNSASSPVNAIRYVPGSGIVVMGARTLKPGYADAYVSVRRSLIYVRKSLEALTGFAVFEPNDERLWARLSDVATTFLTDFWQQGGLRGVSPTDAFFVKSDDENNPTNQIDNGQVVLEVGVALQRPAEFVIIRISQYDSGAVVSVS